LNSTVFWIVTLCNSDRARRFGGTWSAYSGWNSKPRKKSAEGIGKLFIPENEAVFSSEMSEFLRLLIVIAQRSSNPTQRFDENLSFLGSFFLLAVRISGFQKVQWTSLQIHSYLLLYHLKNIKLSLEYSIRVKAIYIMTRWSDYRRGLNW
jgi:hypothetical protein